MSAGFPVALSGLADWIPDTSVTAAQAVAAGLIGPEEAASTGYTSLPVSEDLAAPEMAERAARAALARGARDPLQIGFLAHAWTYHQGHDFWSPAHFIAARLGAHRANPVGVQQMCNGGAAALELAIAWLHREGPAAAAVVTTADRFIAPGFDRWRSDYGLWYGDGATAALVERAGGAAAPELELLGLVSRAEPAVEDMHRGDDPFSPAPRTHSSTVDIRRTKKAFLRDRGKDRFAEITAVRVPEVVRGALRAAGVSPADPRLRCAALPRLGRRALSDAYYPALGAVLGVPALDLGAETGHLGAGDLLANLAVLSRPGALEPGELAVVLGAGGGFTWSCAVVRKPAPTDHEREEPRVR